MRTHDIAGSSLNSWGKHTAAGERQHLPTNKIEEREERSRKDGLGILKHDCQAGPAWMRSVHQLEGDFIHVLPLSMQGKESHALLLPELHGMVLPRMIFPVQKFTYTYYTDKISSNLVVAIVTWVEDYSYMYNRHQINNNIKHHDCTLTFKQELRYGLLGPGSVE